MLFDDLFSFEKHTNSWFGFNYNETVFALYAVFMLAACIINVFDVRITSLLNTVSAYWHMIGVAIIVVVLIVVPSHHQSLSYVFTGKVNATGYGGNVTGFQHAAFWLVFGLGLLDVAVHDHRLRRLCAHGGGDAPGLADGGGRDVHVGDRLGDLRLHPARRGHVRDPEHERRPDATSARSCRGSGQTSMSQNWSDALLFICVVAQFFCLTASTTSALADDVRVLA